MKTNNIALYSSVLQENLITRLREISAERLECLNNIKTLKMAMEYVMDVRRKIRRCFGVFPKRTPLNLHVICEDVRDGYKRRNLIFESRPGYYVSGCMYIPDGEEKVPVVLGICGHGTDGKAQDEYQTFCIGLAKQGYLVLMADPVSQGERWQYADDGFSGKTWCGKSSVYEHNTIGKAQSLVGEFFGTWRVWDKIRALDVLLSHPRADRDRVGVTGCSGGGTLSSYIFALDDRVTMAAPACYITSFLNNLENSLPCDAEQMVPGILAAGLDMGDLLLARAPLPVIVLAEKYDFFDVRGAEEFYSQARRIYKLLGYEKSLQLFIDNGGHGYHRPLREAMYGFFNRQTAVKSTTSEDDLKIHIEPKEMLYSASGNVNAAGSRLAWEFAAEKVRRLKAARPKYLRHAKLKQLEKLLLLPRRDFVCHYRKNAPHLYNEKGEDVKYIGQQQYILEVEQGINLTLCRFMGKDIFPACYGLFTPKKMELFIPNRSAEDEVDIENGLIMSRRMEEAWILEPRGMGNTMPQSLHGFGFEHPYGLDYMLTTTYEMLGESMMGKRVYDVLCVLDLFVANGTEKITLTGRGLGAIIATFAGQLHRNVIKVNIIEPPPSYYEMSQQPLTRENTSYMVRDILKYFDWTDFIE